MARSASFCPVVCQAAEGPPVKQCNGFGRSATVSFGLRPAVRRFCARFPVSDGLLSHGSTTLNDTLRPCFVLQSPPLRRLLNS